MEMTISEAAATARGVSAERMPCSTSSTALARVRFQPVTLCPAAISRGTISLPMAPRPIKPMSTQPPRPDRKPIPAAESTMSRRITSRRALPYLGRAKSGLLPTFVIAALVAAIQREAGSGASVRLDAGDKPQHDKRCALSGDTGVYIGAGMPWT